MAGLILENISKSFAGKSQSPALDGLNLEIQSGELLVLLGSSGSGKTTALRLIAGLEIPNSGRVLLDDQVINDLPAHTRSVSMAFQYPALLPQLTVAQNLALGPKLRKTPLAEIEPRVRRISELLKIAELLPRFPETLSGGQMQRVALGRALVAQPRLLLLDEPLANLDPIARAELRDTIRSIHRDLHLTTLYVTHDQSEAVAIADRIALLRNGQLQQLGSPAELYRNPANLFVAQFIGPDGINLLPGSLTTEANSLRFESKSLDTRWIIPTSDRAFRDQPAIAAFRPSAVMQSHQEGVLCIITDRIDYGWKTLVTLSAPSMKFRAEISPDSPVVIGDTVQIQFPLREAFYFDPASGNRLV